MYLLELDLLPIRPMIHTQSPILITDITKVVFTFVKGIKNLLPYPQSAGVYCV